MQIQIIKKIKESIVLTKDSIQKLQERGKVSCK